MRPIWQKISDYDISEASGRHIYDIVVLAMTGTLL